LVSVFLIVSVMGTAMTALVIYVEKNRFQKKELDRIHLMTDAMKIRLGHLMHGENWRYLMMTLTNAKAADPSVLYFAVTGPNGQVLVSDRKNLIGKPSFDLTRYSQPAIPLYKKASPNAKGKFWIFQAAYHPDSSQAGEQDIVFEAIHDIVYLGEPMGQLRVGYSRRPITQHIILLSAGMLGTGISVLAVVLALIFVVIRNHMVPVESFINQIASLDFRREGTSLKQSLATIPLKRQPGETRDVHQLKQAFEHLRDQFVDASDELERHRTDLEGMVARRTKDLNRQIEERKTIEARLLMVQKLEAMGTLAGGIAHEFNNLFMAINGYATLIQKRVPPEHPNVEKADKIRDLVNTGAQSVQQLMGFARSGQLDPGPLNLNEVIRGSLVVLTQSRKGLDITSQCQDSLWTVHGDRSQMEQVVMNLLINASDALPEGGEIGIQTENHVFEGFQVSLDKKVSGRFACLSVSDAGKGISPELLPRIFDPFFTTKKVGAGSGMGLASVFGIVENHGGFIMVDSAPGQGSRFDVYLPAMTPGT